MFPEGYHESVAVFNDHEDTMLRQGVQAFNAWALRGLFFDNSHNCWMRRIDVRYRPPPAPRNPPPVQLRAPPAKHAARSSGGPNAPDTDRDMGPR